MKTIARITAIILIILGLLVMLGGITTVAIGALRSGQRALSAAPRPAGLGGVISGLALAVILFVQGLVVIATGEGLYLLADISHRLPAA